MANITELLDKLKEARQTVELVDACCISRRMNPSG